MSSDQSYNVGMTNADFIKPGVIFGYRARGDWGDDAAYYFGRTKQAASLELDIFYRDDQKTFLQKKSRRVGLNAPARILLWWKVDDVDKYWDKLKEQLRGWLVGVRQQVAGTQPIITNQLVLGDNWFTVENMGTDDFGSWVCAIANVLERPPRVMHIEIEV